MRLILVGVALLAAALAPSAAEAQELRVYSSMPLQGASRPQAQAIVNGARLALAEAGGAAGGRPVRLVSRNNARGGAWDPGRTASNTRRAATDRRAVGYIGELNSGASAISIPILNDAGVPQVSPSSTAIGLTRGGPGAEPGEPDKYYPMANRTFFRLQPNDRVQGGAVAAAMRGRGCTRVALLHDGRLYGRGVNRAVRAGARRLACASSPTAASADRAARRSAAPGAPGRTASPSPASPPTAPCRCSARSVAHCRAPASSAATASPSPASRAGCRAGSLHAPS